MSGAKEKMKTLALSHLIGIKDEDGIHFITPLRRWVPWPYRMLIRRANLKNKSRTKENPSCKK